MDICKDNDRSNFSHRGSPTVTTDMFSLRENAGSTAPLGIGLAMLSLAAILMFASASSAFLLQRRLTSLAEYAALSEARFEMPASEFLGKAGVSGLQGVRVAVDQVSDGLTVEITLCSMWSSPLPGLVSMQNFEVCGRGAARAG